MRKLFFIGILFSAVALSFTSCGDNNGPSKLNIFKMEVKNITATDATINVQLLDEAYKQYYMNFTTMNAFFHYGPEAYMEGCVPKSSTHSYPYGAGGVEYDLLPNTWYAVYAFPLMWGDADCFPPTGEIEYLTFKTKDLEEVAELDVEYKAEGKLEILENGAAFAINTNPGFELTDVYLSLFPNKDSGMKGKFTAENLNTEGKTTASYLSGKKALIYNAEFTGAYDEDSNSYTYSGWFITQTDRKNKGLRTKFTITCSTVIHKN